MTLHPVLTGTDPVCDQVSLAAARSFLRAESREQVAEVLHGAVRAMGGIVVPVWEDRHDVLPVDVSLGTGEPRLVLAVGQESRRRLDIALPALLADALETAARCDRHAQEVWRARVDELTGVASRREIMPRVRAARPGDVVCLLDLDHFKELNDATGHVGGDEALRRFGALLQDSTRPQDFVGRYGGDEFVLIMRQTRLPVAVRRLQEVGERWRSGRGSGLSFSAGAARVDERGGPVALDDADRALYSAKRKGRDRVEMFSASAARTADLR